MKRTVSPSALSALVFKMMAAVSLWTPAASLQAWVDQPQCLGSLLESVDNYPPGIRSCYDLDNDQAVKDAMYDVADACLLSMVRELSDQVNGLVILVEDLVFAPDQATGKRAATTIVSLEGAVEKIAEAAASFAKGSVAHVQACAGEGISTTIERHLRTFKSFNEVVAAAGSLHTDLASSIVKGPHGASINFDNIALVKELRAKLSGYSQHLDNLAADVETVGFALLGDEFEDEIKLRRSKQAVDRAMARLAEPGAVDSPGECRLEELDAAVRDAQQALTNHRWFVLSRHEFYSKSFNCIRDGNYPAAVVTDWMKSRTLEMRTLFDAEIGTNRERMAQADRACRQLESALPEIRGRGDALKARLDRAVGAAVLCDIDAARAGIAEVGEAMQQSRCLLDSRLRYAFQNANQEIEAAIDVCAGTILVADDDINAGNLPPTVDPDRYHWYVIRKRSSGTWHWKNYRCELTRHEPVQIIPKYLDEEISRRRARWEEENRKCQAEGCERGAGFSRIWRPQSWSFDVIMGPLESLPRDDVPGDSNDCSGSMSN